MSEQNKMLTNLEIADFCNQMGMMLGAGISTYEALSLLLEDPQSEKERTLFSGMLKELEITGSLHNAAMQTEVFPNYFLQMIKLGEETGTQDTVMRSLADHYTREANIANMIRSAFIYPSIMLTMMFLIILVLLTQVMPVFNQVFQQLGQEMNGFSAGLLRIGEILSRYSIIFTLLTLLIVLGIYFGRKHLPFQKRMQENIAVCRFADGMAITLKSGISPEQGLEMVAGLVENTEFEKKIDDCRKRLDEGTNLAEALQQSQIFKGSYARLALVANKAGVMDETMAQIASEYEHSVNAKITNLIALLEPTLVIVLSLIVGIILFSVMLPLLGIMSGL